MGDSEKVMSKRKAVLVLVALGAVVVLFAAMVVSGGRDDGARRPCRDAAALADDATTAPLPELISRARTVAAANEGDAAHNLATAADAAQAFAGSDPDGARATLRTATARLADACR